jgi:hypothetical protein
MRNIKWLVLIVLVVMAAGCGSGGGNFEGDDIWQKSFTPGNVLTITLKSGASITLPATTFAKELKIVFSDRLDADDSNPDYYPTSTHAANDMLGGVVLNTPVDTIYNASIPVTIDMHDYGTEAPVVLGDTEYAVFRFDFEENRWNRWGSLTATTNTTGTAATLTLPTTGFMGFLGSIAIFEGMTAVAAGEVAPSYIEGYVKNISNNPLGTDVAIYQLVGDVKYPVDLSSVNIAARIPTLADPLDSSKQITVACVVDSDATTGYFRIEMPWRLIGSLIRLEFGREHAGHQVQDQWVIDYPLPFDEADRGDKISALAVAYGRNTVTPQAVLAGN